MSHGSSPRAADAVRVSVSVAVEPCDAFEVFTQETDLWWRHGARFRIAGKNPGKLAFEPGQGGRLFETVNTAGGERRFEIGQILVWDPPQRLVFEWRGVNFKPHEKTEVEVTFAPSKTGTLVTVEHRGFSSLPSDHPVRHDQTDSEFYRSMGLWWGDLMSAYRVFSAPQT